MQIRTYNSSPVLQITLSFVINIFIFWNAGTKNYGQLYMVKILKNKETKEYIKRKFVHMEKQKEKKIDFDFILRKK